MTEDKRVDLPLGTVRYVEHAPATPSVPRAPSAVLLHGLTMGSYAYASLAPRLAAALGARVLAPDLLGAGRSTLAEVRPHTKAYYVQQVADFLAAVGLWPRDPDAPASDSDASLAPVTLVGHSMGGAVAAAVAARYPRWVERLVLIAPAGLPFEMPFVARMVTGLGTAGSWLFWLAAARVLPYTRDGDFFKECEGKQKVRDEIVWSIANTPHFLESVLSIMQNLNLSGGFEEDFEKLGKVQGMRILQVWGDKDQTVDFANTISHMRELVPQCEFVIIEGCGHQPLFEDPEPTESAICSFLSR
eukprot:m51a1_g6263 hypothetical protein (302) ;mRNA; r:129800-131067